MRLKNVRFYMNDFLFLPRARDNECLLLLKWLAREEAIYMGQI